MPGCRKILHLVLLLCSYFMIMVGYSQELPDEKQSLDSPDTEIFLPEDDLENNALEERGEAWDELIKDPVRINEKDVMELARLFFLSHDQLDNLFQYLVRFGPMVSIYELQVIEGLDPVTMHQLSAVIRLETRRPLPWSSDVLATTRIRQELKINAVGVVENLRDFLNSGNDTSQTTGSPIRLRLRYGMQLSNGLELTIAGEKDPQEFFFRGPQKNGFDFYSGNLTYKGGGFVKRVVIGDYQLSTGQGLFLWNAFMAGTSGSSGGLLLSSKGLLSVARSSEGNFFRGAALFLQWKGFHLIPFYSDPGQASQSLNPDRYLGACAGWRGEHLELGAGWFNAEPYAAQNAKLQSTMVSFSQKLSLNRLGASFKYINGKTLVYVEGTVMQDKVRIISYLAGLEWKALPGFQISLQIHDFPWFSSEAFNCSSFKGNPCLNNRGLLVSLKFQTSDKLQWLCRLERSETPWTTSTLSAPGIKTNGSLSLTYTERNGNTLCLRLNHKEWENNAAASNEITESILPARQYDLQLAFHLESRIQYDSRIHFLAARQAVSTWQQAWLFYQQLRTSFFRGRLFLTLGYAQFDTDGWDTRLYLNTGATSFSQSFQALAGQGSKSCIQLSYKWHRKLEISAFYTRLIYYDRGSIGSGSTLIPGNCRSDLGIQMKLQW